MDNIIGIVCRDKITHGIGLKNTIPFNIPEDRKFFYNTTNVESSLLICGYNTYKSLPASFNLSKRSLCVIIDERKIDEQFGNMNVHFVKDKELIGFLNEKDFKHIFLIGGSKVYTTFMHLCKSIIVCEHNQSNHEYDAFFPDPCDIFLPGPILVNAPNYTVTKWIKKIDHPESKFIFLMNKILKEGSCRDQERTGTGSLSLFGEHIIIDLSDGYCPIMNTRKMTPSLIVGEFKWYLSGSTNVADLKRIINKTKTVWDANTSREFLDSQGLCNLPEGDIGASYGFQMRHFGANYKTCNDNYENQGTDQIAALIDGLNSKPQSRRHIVSLWNPSDLSQMALPPCLRDYQFYIRNNDGKLFLDCKADQRSSDYFLAGYWNIHQIAYFIYYILNAIDNKEIKPGKIILNYGDVHIYNHQIDVCKKQIELFYRALEEKKINYPQVHSFSNETGFELLNPIVPLSELTSRMAL